MKNKVLKFDRKIVEYNYIISYTEKKNGIQFHPNPLHFAGVGFGSTFPESGSADPDQNVDP